MNEGHLQFLASPEWAQLLEADLLPWVQSIGDLGDDVLEIGPGPGLTTDLLRTRVSKVTAVEVDTDLASKLAQRLADTNVRVIAGDATDARLQANRFSTAMCFSVLHHMPSAADQDRLFAETQRVLRPGGRFLGVDPLDIDVIRDGHVDDTFTPIDPETFPDRLEAVGFCDVHIDPGDYQFRFIASKM